MIQDDKRIFKNRRFLGDLNNMAEENLTLDQDEHLIKPEEAAGILNIAKITLYRLVEKNEIPFIKIGRVLRFRKSSLYEYIEEKELDNGKHQN